MQKLEVVFTNKIDIGVLVLIQVNTFLSPWDDKRKLFIVKGKMYCFTTLDNKRKNTSKNLLSPFRFSYLCRKTKNNS